jgi:hypothetical protein
MLTTAFAAVIAAVLASALPFDGADCERNGWLGVRELCCGCCLPRPKEALGKGAHHFHQHLFRFCTIRTKRRVPSFGQLTHKPANLSSSQRIQLQLWIIAQQQL